MYIFIVSFTGNYFHGSGYKYTLSENKKHLYNILVKEEKISDNPRRYKSNIDEIVKRAEEFSRIEINFEKLKENDAIRYHSRGRIREIFDIMNSELLLYSLRPQLDFETKFLKDEKKPGFLSIIRLLLRKTQF